MLRIKAENKKGEILDFSEHPEYVCIVEDGLTPPGANVVTTAISTMDGERFNYTKLTPRNIVMTVYPNGDVEKARVHLYKWFATKNHVKLYLTTDSRDVFIEGYVEKMDGGLFVNPQSYQISIVCPDPYFKGIEMNAAGGSYTTPLFEFPFAIDDQGVELSTYDQISSVVVFNESDADGGMTVRLYASDTVVNPKIYRRDTLEHMGLNFTMQEGDSIEISTGKGEKRIVLHRGAETINLINHMMDGFTWLQILTGDNQFTFEAENGLVFLSVQFDYYTIYEGV